MFGAAIGLSAVRAAAERYGDDACKQVVLVGRVTQAAYQGAADPLNGIWKLEIDVSRVWRGSEHRRHIVALAAAEAQIHRGVFVFFLNPGPDGDYGVASADADLGRARSDLRRCE